MRGAGRIIPYIGTPQKTRQGTGDPHVRDTSSVSYAWTIIEKHVYLFILEGILEAKHVIRNHTSLASTYRCYLSTLPDTTMMTTFPVMLFGNNIEMRPPMSVGIRWIAWGTVKLSNLSSHFLAS